MFVWFLLFIFFGVSKQSINNTLHLFQDTECFQLEDEAFRVRDLAAECRFQANLENYYYRLTWREPLLSNRSILAYEIIVKYRNVSYCEKVGSTEFFWETKFYVTETSSILYTVIPRTYIPGNTKAILKESIKCPVIAKLQPLPNVNLDAGSNFSFHCLFYEDPTPKPLVEWYFTRDKIKCDASRQLIRNTSYMTVSKDKLILDLPKVSKTHVGCYIVMVEDDLGNSDEQRGYLDVKEDRSKEDHRKHNEVGELAESTILILSGVFLISLLAAIASNKFLKMRRKKNVYEEDILKRVYISHCIKDAKDQLNLLKFTNLLAMFQIEVIIDICNEEAIEASGGLSQWIADHITRADKVLVILDLAYISALGSPEIAIRDENGYKVLSEFRFICEKFYGNREKANEVVVISKGVKPKDLPPILESKPCYNFPKELYGNLGEDMDQNFQDILKALLEREPQIRGKNGYHHV